MGLKTEAWILKASHQSVNQNHVLRGSLLTERPNVEHREEKGNRLSLKGLSLLKGNTEEIITQNMYKHLQEAMIKSWL